MLQEVEIELNRTALPDRVAAFAVEGIARSKSIDCFDFVPSSFSHCWQVISKLEPGRFCEWGSGIGIATGIADMAGHRASGIEINENLVAASRNLLSDFGIECEIHCGSYFDLAVEADFYFVYCWPGQMNLVESHFENSAPTDAKLLICHGAEDIRCKIRA